LFISGGEAPKLNIRSSLKSKNSTYGIKTQKNVTGLFVIMGLQCLFPNE
jgi:hypothetical protein